MAYVEDLVETFRAHISAPWRRSAGGAERTIMLVYDKEKERHLRARKSLFKAACEESHHSWVEVDLSDAFARWMAADEYREAYFEDPESLLIKLDEEFRDFVAAELRVALTSQKADADAVVAVFGAGALFGFAHVSEILKQVETATRGRLLVFFPGHADRNNFRLLDARDGWNYLAATITVGGDGAFV